MLPIAICHWIFAKCAASAIKNKQYITKGGNLYEIEVKNSKYIGKSNITMLERNSKRINEKRGMYNKV